MFKTYNYNILRYVISYSRAQDIINIYLDVLEFNFTK